MRQLFSIAAAVGILVFGAGCGSNNTGDGGGGSSGNGLTGQQAVVDLSVADSRGHQVAIYLDILNFYFNGGSGEPQPDIVFDEESSGMALPVSLDVTDTDMVICDGREVFFFSQVSGNDQIDIYRNYRDAASGAVPDTIFTNGGTIGQFNNPAICLIDEEDDALIVGSDFQQAVKIVYNFSTIPDGTDPAITVVTLDDATSLINGVRSLAVAGGDLYTANYRANSFPDPCVTIYRDIPTLTDGAPPDVILDTEVVFFDQPSNFCNFLTVGENPFDSADANALYVTTSAGAVYVFLDADNLSTNDLPDAVLFSGDDSFGSATAFEPAIVGNHLYIPSLSTACGAVPNLAVFSPIGGLTTGQAADFSLGPLNGEINHSFGAVLAGNALFVQKFSDCNFNRADLLIFGNGLAMSATSQPAIEFKGNLAPSVGGLTFPRWIAARERPQPF